MGMSTFTASDITSCTFNDVSILEMVLKTVRLSACPLVRCERVATELRVTSSIWASIKWCLLCNNIKR